MIGFNSHCCLWLSKAAILINFAGSSIYIPSCSWWLQRRLSRIGLESMRKLEVPSKLLTYLIYLYIFCAKSYDARKRVFFFLGFTASSRPRKALWKARQMALLHGWSLVVLCGILQTLHLASKPSDVTRRFLTKGQLSTMCCKSLRFSMYWRGIE